MLRADLDELIPEERFDAYFIEKASPWRVLTQGCEGRVRGKVGGRVGRARVQVTVAGVAAAAMSAASSSAARTAGASARRRACRLPRRAGRQPCALPGREPRRKTSAQALGLELDLLKRGAFVRAVRPGGQAERLQARGALGNSARKRPRRPRSPSRCAPNLFLSGLGSARVRSVARGGRGADAGHPFPMWLGYGRGHHKQQQHLSKCCLSHGEWYMLGKSMSTLSRHVMWRCMKPLPLSNPRCEATSVPPPSHTSRSRMARPEFGVRPPCPNFCMSRPAPPNAALHQGRLRRSAPEPKPRASPPPARRQRSARGHRWRGAAGGPPCPPCPPASGSPVLQV